jgi:putative transposase
VTPTEINGFVPTATRSRVGNAVAAASAPWSTQAPPRPTLRTSAKVTYHCVFHVAWCTQYRSPVLTVAIAERLKQVITEVVAAKEAWLIELNISPVHVHVVLDVAPQLGIHRLVKAIKARSARVLRDEFTSLRSRVPSLWTNAYLVTTAGQGMPSPMVEQFVATQPTRQSRKTSG